VQQEHVARLDHHAVGVHDLLERRQVHPAPLVAQVTGQVHEHAPALDAVVGHVLQPEVAGEAAVTTPVSGGVVRGPTRSAPAR
jgi:5,10-methylene-tetrahydrofolate dehydrogenase/methenyl tetrahydrofolate cyclohydrolase